METATVTIEGDHQTVRLPKGFRLPMPKVAVRRQEQSIVLEPLIPETQPPTQGPRILGLHEGQTWVSEDFDAPLPDSFWTGEKEE